jgi:DNA helicase-2/ATP-dependent DNA helicase PcrA
MEIQSVIPCEYRQTAHFTTGSSINAIPASQVLPGMVVFIKDGNEVCTSVIDSVERIWYSGVVYDLDVDFVHNYIANGIVTHNSIYGYSGANC